jgi:probable phosphoglycerate mutase
VVRHGETEWSRSGQHTSRTDLPLLEIGRRQAELIGQRLRGAGIDRIDAAFVSPRRRARETAALAGWPDAVVRDDLAEWDYGDYEGRTTDDIHRDNPGWSLFADGAPNGEAAADVGARADRFIGSVRDRPGTVVVFSHGHFIRVLAARWVGLPPQQGEVFGPLAAGGVGTLAHERTAAVVRAWNDAAAVETPAER